MTHEVAPIIKLAELESPSVIMMSGVPGSGKSYLAEQLGSLLHIPVISSDAIREEISGDADNQEVSAEAWQLLYNRVEHSIRDQQTIIVDATHALREYRISDIKRYRLYGAQSVVAANVLTTRETALIETPRALNTSFPSKQLSVCMLHSPVIPHAY